MKILERADPPALITDICGELGVLPLHSETEFSYAESEAAVILFTSGSTGEPKGVMLSEQNLLSNAREIADYLKLTEKDKVLISRPLYHSSVLTGELLVSLLCGADIVFSSQAFSPVFLLGLIRERGISVFGTTPTLAAQIARFSRKGCACGLRKLLISGECVSEGAARVIRKGFGDTEVWCGYGLSEASPRVAYLPPEHFDTEPSCAGLTLPSVRVKIADAEMRDVTRGELGQVLVKGDGVMLGYFRDEARTREVLRNGWLCTGDIGYIDGRGMLYIKGRADDMIIRAGMNIYPIEIENALCADGRVEELAVYGYPCSGTHEIALRIKGRFADIGEVAQLCRERLPSHQIPSKIELVDEFARSANGKKKRYEGGRGA